MRRILKRLQIRLPFEDDFNKGDNPYNHEAFLKVCNDYGVTNNQMKYRGEYYASSEQREKLVYFDDSSTTRWIIEKSQGFTKPGLYMISKSVQAYAFLILSSQASARSNIIGNNADSITAQEIFMDNFEKIINRRADSQEDIKRYQDTLNYASSKVDFSVGEGIYMMPSNMNLNIKRSMSGYNNEILIAKSSFEPGINHVNEALHKARHKVIPSPNKKLVPHHKNIIATPVTTITSNAVTHEEEKVALVLLITTGFSIWYMF